MIGDGGEFGEFIISRAVGDSRVNNRICQNIRQAHQDPGNPWFIRILNPVLVRVVPDIISERGEDRQLISEIKIIIVLGLFDQIGERVIHLIRIGNQRRIRRQCVGNNRDTVISRRQAGKGVIAVFIGHCLINQMAFAVKQPQHDPGQSFAQRWRCVTILILPYHIPQRDRVLGIHSRVQNRPLLPRIDGKHGCFPGFCVHGAHFGLIVGFIPRAECVALEQIKCYHILSWCQALKAIAAIPICLDDGQGLPCLVKEPHRHIGNPLLSVILDAVTIRIIPYPIPQTGKGHIRQVHPGIKGGIMLAC